MTFSIQNTELPSPWHIKSSWANSILIFVILFSPQGYANDEKTHKASYNEIYNVVFSDPYIELPQYKVTKKLFGKSGDRPENHALTAAKRSLSSQTDLFDFPQKQKLFQPNGVCFAGRWLIQQPSRYTGLFEEGVNVPVIVRASVALDGTLQKHKRAFGMAIKIFPHADPNLAVETSNVFVMNTL